MIGVTNLTPDKHTAKIDFLKNLDLPPARYAVYDYWNRTFLGIFRERLEIALKPFDTGVLRITPLENGLPAVISISRHLTQGGYELKALTIAEERIGGTVLCAAGEPCTITILLPDKRVKVSSEQAFARNGQLVMLSLHTETGGAVPWRLDIESV